MSRSEKTVAGCLTLCAGLWMGCPSGGGLDADTWDAGVTDVDGGQLDVADTAEAPLSLVDNTAWHLVSVDDDPFVTSDGPAPDLCPDADVGAETTPDGVWLEIDTTGCAWATLSQGLLEEVPAGSHIHIVVTHFELVAGDTDYTVRVALGEDAEPLWETEVALGSAYALLETTVEVATAYDVGAPIWFHVSNHGTNNWALVTVERITP